MTKQKVPFWIGLTFWREEAVEVWCLSYLDYSSLLYLVLSYRSYSPLLSILYYCSCLLSFFSSLVSEVFVAAHVGKEQMALIPLGTSSFPPSFSFLISLLFSFIWGLFLTVTPTDSGETYIMGSACGAARLCHNQMIEITQGGYHDQKLPCLFSTGEIGGLWDVIFAWLPHPRLEILPSQWCGHLGFLLRSPGIFLLFFSLIFLFHLIYLIRFDLIWFDLIWFDLIWFDLILFHFISFYFILFHFISFYFIFILVLFVIPLLSSHYPPIYIETNHVVQSFVQHCPINGTQATRAEVSSLPTCFFAFLHLFLFFICYRMVSWSKKDIQA